jgi:hypothetical protein
LGGSALLDHRLQLCPVFIGLNAIAGRHLSGAYQMPEN